MNVLHDELLEIYERRATGRYGLEDVSQLEHALQTATRAEEAGAAPALVLACLLHDVGHLVHKLGENPAAGGVDDKHEVLGAKWLAKRGLPAAVTEPIRLHVAAKRFLCGTEPDYFSKLAPDSVLSLSLQGGPMGAEEADAFRALPFAQDAVALRRYDEAAKEPHAMTPDAAHYLSLLPAVALGDDARAAFARDRFVVLRDFFSDAEAMQLDGFSRAFGMRAAAVLARGGSPADAAREPGSLIVVPEADDATTVCRFEYLMGADDAFRALVMARIAPVIAALAGETYLPFKDKENEKHPGGGAFRPHQDFAAYQSFGPRYEITAMLSIDAATCANGCLEFARDWRRVDDMAVEARVDGHVLLRFHKGGALNGDVLEEIAEGFAWASVETGPRDLVLFDSFVPHRSAPNRTAASRRAMFLTFNPAREGDWYERYYADKRANYDDPKFHVSTPTAHRAV